MLEQCSSGSYQVKIVKIVIAVIVDIAIYVNYNEFYYISKMSIEMNLKNVSNSRQTTGMATRPQPGNQQQQRAHMHPMDTQCHAFQFHGIEWSWPSYVLWMDPRVVWDVWTMLLTHRNTGSMLHAKEVKELIDLASLYWYTQHYTYSSR